MDSWLPANLLLLPDFFLYHFTFFSCSLIFLLLHLTSKDTRTVQDNLLNLLCRSTGAGGAEEAGDSSATSL